jgi:hypothetical protein
MTLALFQNSRTKKGHSSHTEKPRIIQEKFHSIIVYYTTHPTYRKRCFFLKKLDELAKETKPKVANAVCDSKT